MGARWVAAALGLFGLWTLATWWLEGRIHTLLRPEAALDRVLYVGVANLAIGVLGGLVLARAFLVTNDLSRDHIGLSVPVRDATVAQFGGVLGFSAYMLQSPPDVPAMVAVNAYAQVLGVTVAEVVVCWGVLGIFLREYLRRWLTPFWASLPAMVVSAGAFGLYHFAHSPPFDTWAMVGKLALVGLVTGVVFFALRSLYAAIFFHNFLGTRGVVEALQSSGRIDVYTEPFVPALSIGAIMLLTTVLADRFIVRPPPKVRS